MRNFLYFCFAFILVLQASSCSQQYYSQEDFLKTEKIDTHVHLFTLKSNLIEQAKADNFKLVTINTDAGDSVWVNTQFEISRAQAANYPETVSFAVTFNLNGWDEPEWSDRALQIIKDRIGQGGIAVKVWKNIGMGFRDRNGQLIMIDDPKFDPVFKYLAENKIPVYGHLGEPKNCWLPIEKMTSKSDRNYFAAHPQYHMYLHPEFPSYDDQIAARNRMLDKNPGLTFIGCHLASLEWSVDELGAFLDRYPNASVDMAERMVHFFYQTISDREKVRNFFIKYQDRLLYGTDLSEGDQSDAEELKRRVHATYLFDWSYFTTDDLLTNVQLLDGQFQGLKLPKAVVDKIYSGNARKYLKVGGRQPVNG